MDKRDDGARPDEGPDTANLAKNELYEMVSTTRLLPPLGSKGVTREYVLGCYKDQYYTIHPMDYKRFEINLSKDQLRKTCTFNNALLLRKLNILLSSQGKAPLGFKEEELPDQTWLHKMARYIDQTGLLEFFEAPIKPEPPLTPLSHSISRVYYGRLYASDYLFRLPQVKTNKKLLETIKMVSETYRTLCSYKINIEMMESELNSMRMKY